MLGLRSVLLVDVAMDGVSCGPDWVSLVLGGVCLLLVCVALPDGSGLDILKCVGIVTRHATTAPGCALVKAFCSSDAVRSASTL